MLASEPYNSEIIEPIREAKKLLETGNFREIEKKLKKYSENCKNPELYYLLGIARRELGKFEQAKQNLQQAIRLDSRNAKYFTELGVLFYMLRDVDDAKFYFKEALSLNDKFFDAYYNLGFLERNRKNYRKALEYFRKASEIRPENFIALYNIGYIYHLNKEYEKSAEFLEKALKIEEKNPEAHFLLGSVFLEKKQFEKALTHFRKATELDKTNARYFTNLGITYHYLGMFSDAKKALEKAIKLNEKDYDAKLNFAATLYQLGEYEESLRVYDEIVNENPQDKIAKFNRALVLLKTGNYADGLRDYEFRLSEEQLRALPQIPFWKGESLRKKTILVLDEQGAGDVIQFVRYLQILRKRGAKVIFQTKKELYSLFLKNNIADKIIYELNDSIKADFKIHLMSLPKILGVFPFPQKKYLQPTEETYLPFEESKDLKIGVVWRGNPENIYDKLRSLSLESFKEFFKLPNTLFFSFQVDSSKEEKQKMRNLGVIDLSDKIKNFEDTANLLEKIDLVITVDTAFAHLSGALGKKTWILIGEQDWRWETESEKTPWYESVLLFRKKHDEAWEIPLGKALSKLEEFVEQRYDKEVLLIKYNAMNEINASNWEKAADLLKLYLSKTEDNEIYFWLGFSLRQMNKIEEAKTYFRKAVEHFPNNFQAIQNLAEIYLLENDFKNSTKYYKKLLKFEDSPEILNNLAFSLFKEKKFEKAEKYFEAAIEKNPQAGYYLNAANNYFEAGKLEKALDYYDKAIEIANLVGAHVGKSLLLLSLGNFKEGFKEFLWTLTKQKIPANFGKEWRGENLDGKSIVVYTDFGLGDAIQFFRFIPALKKRNATVKIVCAPALKNLFESSEFVDEVKTDWFADADYHIPMLALPVALGVKSEKELALSEDLFTLDKTKTESYKRTFAAEKLNVGLVWKTYSKAGTTHDRSIPEKEIKTLFEAKEVQFYVLQIDTPEEIKNEFEKKYENVTFVNKDFYELAHFVKALDAVVSIDSSVLHLAGTVKANTFALINKFADWRWKFEGEKSYLYPTVKLFRQEKYFTWKEPLEKIKSELQNLLENKKKNTEPDEERWYSSVTEVNKLVEKYLAKGKPEVAKEILEESLEYFFDNEDILFRSAYVNQLLGNLDNAIYYYNLLINKNPLHVDALNNLGVALREKGKTEQAEKILKLANNIQPQNISTLNNLGLTEENKGNFKEALIYYDKALKINPDFRDALLNKANSLMFLYRFNDAVAAIDKILRQNPGDVSANYNKAVIHLFMKDFPAGFEFYEWRRRRPEYLHRSFSKPELTNTEISGKKILVYDEQGYGDTIQFFRFVELLKEAGAQVILQTHASLTPLFANCPEVDSAIPRTTLGDPENIDYDFHIPLLSLPKFFGIKNEQQLSRKFPYINIDMKLKEKYRNEIFNSTKPKVGLVWEGKKPVYNEHRSTTLEAYEPLIKKFDFEFYSLQQKNVAEQYKNKMEELGIIDLSEHLRDFNQTAAIIANLDFVITIDTSIAHLCGALNKKTYVLLSRKADWRWDTGEKTPWYNSLELIRQERLRDWQPVIEKLTQKINSSETDFKLIN